MKILKVKKSSTIGIDIAGTKAVKGYKIVLFTGDVPEDAKVLATENEKIKQAPLLAFFLPVPKLSKSGKVTGEKELKSLTNKLQCLAGKRWIY